MLGHCFPFNRTIKRILGRFYHPNTCKELLVSSRYLYESRRVFHAYYSDRERIIVQLNRYLERGDIEQFIKWLPFYEQKSHLHLIHLIIGVFFLDLT